MRAIKEVHQPTHFIIVYTVPDGYHSRTGNSNRVSFVISEYEVCKRVIQNKMQPSEWNYNETNLLIAWLSLVIYNAIIQSCTKLNIKGSWVVGRVGV